MAKQRSAASRAVALAGGALVLALVLGGCGAQPAPGSGAIPSGTTSASPTPSPRDAGDPLGLVGSWRVTGTDEPAGTVLRLSGTDLSLWRECGVLMGSWQATGDGLFLADAVSRSGSCPAPTVGTSPTPGWLTSAARFARAGEGWRLSDATGRVVAVLAAGAALTPRPDVDPALATPPVVDDVARSALADPAPLPAGRTAATWRELLGRWAPPGDQAARPTAPYLEVDRDGTWTASDGCNESSGRWALGPDGRLLTTSGASTLIGCQNVDVAGTWSRAARVAAQDGQLVLLDAQATELNRLARSPELPTRSHGPVVR